jgi:sugar-specific transcriptional regulator TrmB
VQSQIEQLKYMLSNMGLNEYQASALSYLIYLGETKATELSKASGVPNARIYGVLEELSQKGLVIFRPGRPVLYAPKSPNEVSEALISDAKAEISRKLITIESYRDEFTKVASELFMKGGKVKVRTPLVRVVGVGEVSIEETKKLFRLAKNEIMILTRAMEYFTDVEIELKDAATRGILIRILLRSRRTLTESDAQKRDDVLVKIKELRGNIAVRVTDEVLIRGNIIDPKHGGRALFLVEEEKVPYYLREAAITMHPGVVRGLADMFDLRWKHQSSPID